MNFTALASQLIRFITSCLNVRGLRPSWAGKATFGADCAQLLHLSKAFSSLSKVFRCHSAAFNAASRGYLQSDCSTVTGVSLPCKECHPSRPSGQRNSQSPLSRTRLLQAFFKACHNCYRFGCLVLFCIRKDCTAACCMESVAPACCCAGSLPPARFLFASRNRVSASFCRTIGDINTSSSY